MRYDQVNGILLNEVLKDHCTLDQPERRKIHNPPYLRLLQWLLYAIAILALYIPGIVRGGSGYFVHVQVHGNYE